MIYTIFKQMTLLLFIGLAISCGPDTRMSALKEEAPEQDWKLGQATNDSTLIGIKMFRVSDRVVLADLPSVIPVIVFNQLKKNADGSEEFAPIGFAVNCKDSDLLPLLNAFGKSFIAAGDSEKISEEDLNTSFRVTEQPILRCDAVKGINQKAQLFSHVYRVIDRQAHRAHYLVRFNAYSPIDKRLFEVGCRNILDTFLNPTNGNPLPSIPLFKESLNDLPGADDIGALHCFQESSALPQDISLAYQKAAAPRFDARLFRVQDAELGLTRVLLSGDKAFRLDCPGTDAELQKAFGFPSTGNLETITAADKELFDQYLNGKIEEQPALECPSIWHPQFATDAYQVLNQNGADQRSSLNNPVMRLKTDESTLVQFSCESAARVFAGSLIEKLTADPGRMIQITKESLAHVPRKYVPGQLHAKFYQIGCSPERGGPRREDIQTAFLRVFGTPAFPDWVEDHEVKIKAQLKTFRYEDIVNYFVNDMAFSAHEVNMITGRAFLQAKGRDPTAAERNLFANLILNQRKLRPHYSELVAHLTYSYNENTIQSSWPCLTCNRDALTLSIEDVKFAFLEVFGLPADEAYLANAATRIRSSMSSFHPQDVVNYFIYGMATSEWEVKLITERAFRAAIFRDPKPEEAELFQTMILKTKILRPYFLEVASYLRSVPRPSETLLRDGSTYRFVVESTGKCLDINFAKDENGTPAQQWACNGGTAQDFTVQAVGNGYYTLVLKSNGKCLDVSSGYVFDETKIQLWECNDFAHQRFFAERAGDGSIRLKPGNSGLCLEAETSAADDGVRIQQSVCRAGKPTQVWIPLLAP